MNWDFLRRAVSQTRLRKRIRRLTSGGRPGKTFYPVGSDCQVGGWDYLLELAFGRRQRGYFVEVGANDGVSHSNTYVLAELGWDGIYVEPVPDLAKLCRRNHRGHSVQVVEVAVSAPGVDHLEVAVAGELSSASPVIVDLYRTLPWARQHVTDRVVVVRAVTLDQILSDYSVPIEFDLLVVDVEGFEEEVFQGLDLQRFRPRVIVVELVDTHRDFSKMVDSSLRIRSRIEDAGYVVQYKDAVNTVFFHQSIMPGPD